MKKHPKLFVMTSITTTCIFSLILNILTSIGIIMNHMIAILALAILLTLVGNAIIVVPIVICSRLEREDRGIFVRILALVSLIVALSTMGFMHLAMGYGSLSPEFGWAFIPAWGGTAILVLVLGIAICFRQAYRRITKKEDKKIFCFLVSFFSVIIIIWAFTIANATISELLR